MRPCEAPLLLLLLLPLLLLSLLLSLLLLPLRQWVALLFTAVPVAAVVVIALLGHALVLVLGLMGSSVAHSSASCGDGRYYAAWACSGTCPGTDARCAAADWRGSDERQVGSSMLRLCDATRLWPH
jgi:hypothetical protein